MIGASVVLLGDAVRGGEDVQWVPMLFGAIVAALVGLGVIRALLAFLRRHSLQVFVWYRLVVEVAVLVGVWVGPL